MGSQPNLASRSEEVSIYKCSTKISGALPKMWDAKTSNFGPLFSATSALDTAYLRNETSHGQTKKLLSIYNVSPTRRTTFRDLWPRNGWDPFAYCDATFGGHYVATIKVATSLVITIRLLLLRVRWMDVRLSWIYILRPSLWGRWRHRPWSTGCWRAWSPLVGRGPSTTSWRRTAALLPSASCGRAQGTGSPSRRRTGLWTTCWRRRRCDEIETTRDEATHDLPITTTSTNHSRLAPATVDKPESWRRLTTGHLYSTFFRATSLLERSEWHVLTRDHRSFTCHPHVYPRME